MKQLGGHLFCTRRASGMAWGTTTPRHISDSYPDRPRAITLPGSLLGLRPNPNGRRRLVRAIAGVHQPEDLAGRILLLVVELIGGHPAVDIGATGDERGIPDWQ
jgi:hypothetical protein